MWPATVGEITLRLYALAALRSASRNSGDGTGGGGGGASKQCIPFLDNTVHVVSACPASHFVPSSLPCRRPPADIRCAMFDVARGLCNGSGMSSIIRLWLNLPPAPGHRTSKQWSSRPHNDKEHFLLCVSQTIPRIRSLNIRLASVSVLPSPDSLIPAYSPQCFHSCAVIRLYLWCRTRGSMKPAYGTRDGSHQVSKKKKRRGGNVVYLGGTSGCFQAKTRTCGGDNVGFWG